MTDTTPEAQAATQAQLAQQAHAVTGQDVAGIYGDPAGAGTPAPAQTEQQVAQGLVAKGAAAAEADYKALLAQVQKLQAAHDAAQPAAPAAAAPLSLPDIVAGTVSSAVHHALTVAETRLAAVERAVGLRKDTASTGT